MDFPLITFEQSLPFSIAGRGLEYYENGTVNNLARDGDTYLATVYGTTSYEVQITIQNGQVNHWACNCPYSQGPICKHVAAVLFEIRALENESMPTKAEELSPEPSDKLLDLLPEAELRHLLKFYAKRYDEVRVHLLTKYANRITDEGAGYYERLVEAIINGYAGGQGVFIAYHDAQKLGSTLYGLAENALKEAEAEQEMRLVYLCQAIIWQLSQAVEQAEDSSSMGTAVEHAFSLLRNLCEEKKETPDEVLDHLFTLSLEECNKEVYQGRLWEGNWRSLAAHAARNKAQVSPLLEKLDTVISQKDGQGYSREYEAESAAKLKLRLLKKWHTPEEADAFLQGQLAFPAFRRIALEQAFADKRYAEVRRLAEEGIALDTENRLPGLIKEWEGWVGKVQP